MFNFQATVSPPGSPWLSSALLGGFRSGSAPRAPCRFSPGPAVRSPTLRRWGRLPPGYLPPGYLPVHDPPTTGLRSGSTGAPPGLHRGSTGVLAGAPPGSWPGLHRGLGRAPDGCRSGRAGCVRSVANLKGCCHDILGRNQSNISRLN